MEINNYLLKKEYDKKIVKQRSLMLHKPCRTRERAFFQFPDDEQQRKTLLRFLNCSDAQEFKHVLVCAYTFQTM